MTQPAMPTEILEQRAAEQRRALHNDVQQLRTMVEAEVREKVDEVKDRLDVKRNVSRHFALAAGAGAFGSSGEGWPVRAGEGKTLYFYRAERSARAGGDLGDRLRHAQPRLHGVRYALRARLP